MTEVPRRLALLFLLAVAGVLVALGLVVAAVGGAAAGAVYAVVVVGALVVAGQLAKRRVRAARFAQGRTCTCCTGTVHDPVQVI